MAKLSCKIVQTPEIHCTSINLCAPCPISSAQTRIRVSLCQLQFEDHSSYLYFEFIPSHPLPTPIRLLFTGPDAGVIGYVLLTQFIDPKELDLKEFLKRPIDAKIPIRKNS